MIFRVLKWAVECHISSKMLNQDSQAGLAESRYVPLYHRAGTENSTSLYSVRDREIDTERQRDAQPWNKVLGMLEDMMKGLLIQKGLSIT